MRMKAPKESTCDQIALLELPHSLHAFQRVSSSDSLNVVRKINGLSLILVIVCGLELLHCQSNITKQYGTFSNSLSR